ncbi:DUF6318 family protein [Kocuria aegyptia]|uniref:DUF6318 domain-containing protein n=1 Tax=Kocuria aegyptia TaxID=330943 RepID=A0ABN2KHE8_9MICC
MVRSNRVGTAVGGVALTALLLTGCGTDDDGAAASPSSTASSAAATSSEASPDATPADYVPASLDGPAQNVPKPVMPDLAREESRDGAQAFLDYWSDAMWYAHQTGDATYAREIISGACDICMEQLEFVEDVYADGAWFVGGRENPVIQDAIIQRYSDGVYKPVVLTSAEGLKLVESNEVTYEAHPRTGQGDPFPVYLDYSQGSWVYITAANLSGAGQYSE